MSNVQQTEDNEKHIERQTHNGRDAELAIKERDNHQRSSSLAELMDLCRDMELELFHTPDGEMFVTFQVNSHRETRSLKSSEFCGWVKRQYYLKFNKAVNRQALEDGLDCLENRAQYEGEEKPVFTRVARLREKLYLDLANENWGAVEITEDGWHVVNDPPVRFRRSKAMAPLPCPAHVTCDEGFSELHKFVNLKTEQEFQLFIGWLLGAFHPSGPYLIAVLCGEQGTAKSTHARVMRAMVDPSTAPLRAMPNKEDDLMVSAKWNWLVVLDNVSKIDGWLSDALCRLSTGGGLSKRAHYTNDEEFTLNAKRPIILTGIGEIVTRSDLQDRSVFFDLAVIDKGHRKTEQDFWRDFEIAQPKILGALCNALSGSLANISSTSLPELPRMADPLLWVTAAEGAMGWPPGAFHAAYTENQRQSNSVILEQSPIARDIMNLADKGWCGTATDLLSKLCAENSDYRDYRSWPANAKSLSDWLKRLAPNLRQAGVEVEWRRSDGTDSKRIITIKRVCVASVAFVAKEQTCDASDSGDAELGKELSEPPEWVQELAPIDESYMSGPV